jgi:hypothetical protein
LLAVHGDRAPLGQLAQGNSVALIVEPDLHTVVYQALSVQPPPRPNVTQQLDNPVFDDAGSHSRLDVVTASAFDDDVVNAIKVQEVTQQ